MLDNFLSFDDETGEFWYKDIQTDIGHAYLGGPCTVTQISSNPPVFKVTGVVLPKRSIYLSEEPQATYGLCGIGIEPFFVMDDVAKFVNVFRPWNNSKYNWLFQPLNSWRLVRPMLKKLVTLYEKDKRNYSFCLMAFQELMGSSEITLPGSVAPIKVVNMFQVTYRETQRIRLSTQEIDNLVLHMVISSVDGKSISLKMLHETTYMGTLNRTFRSIRPVYYAVTTVSNGHTEQIRNEIIENITRCIIYSNFGRSELGDTLTQIPQEKDDNTSDNDDVEKE